MQNLEGRAEHSNTIDKELFLYSRGVQNPEQEPDVVILNAACSKTAHPGHRQAL